MFAQTSPTSGESSRKAYDHLQPFGDDVCASWREKVSSVPLHERALEDLHSLGMEGRIVMLSAPRAGHGKTHLLGRVAEKLSADVIMISLPWQGAEGLNWATTGKGILHDLAKGGRPNALQTLGAGVNALLLSRLIKSGRIPCADKDQALKMLAQDPMELFSHEGGSKMIGDWFRRNFTHLSGQLADVSDIPGSAAVESWLRGLFEYMENPTSVALGLLGAKMSTDSAEQVSLFLKIVSLWKSVVLVADHMDGLYRNTEAGVAIAGMTLTLSTIPSVHVVLSMNQDIWQTTFGGQLPSALEDRLNANNVSLHGVNAEDALALVSLRLTESGVNVDDQMKFLKFLDLDRYFLGRALGSVSARGLLRHVSQQWRSWLKLPQEIEQEPTLEAESFLAESEPEPETSGFLDESDPLPLFEEDQDEEMKRLAQNLSEDAEGEVIDIANHTESTPVPFVNLIPEVEDFLLDSEPEPEPEIEAEKPELKVEETFEAPPSAPSAPPLNAHAGVNLNKLRQMLSKLKAPVPAVAPTDYEALEVESLSGETEMLASDFGQTSEAILMCFEKKRAEIAASGRLDGANVKTLRAAVELAVQPHEEITYQELEIPGLVGNFLQSWSLLGQEVFFGLEDFSDVSYWKTVSSYMIGRNFEIKIAAERNHEPAAQLKIVIFTTSENENGKAAALEKLLTENVIPHAVIQHLNVVSLSASDLATLQAVQQTCSETSPAEADETSAVLAHELDFLVKKATREEVEAA